MPLKIVFAGTPDFAAAHLQALLDSEHQVIAVYSQPDRPSGRGRKLTPSPVKALALEHDLPVFQPKSLKNEEAQAELAELKADVMVVVAYGLLLPKAVLETPSLGCINVHGSVLPRWRGAAPIQRALMAGDHETGITIMQMDEGLDTGDMLLKATCPIESDDTSQSLHDKLIEVGKPLLVAAMNQMAAGEISAEPQDDQVANYAQKLSKAEGELDWQQPADQLHRLVRGFLPWPVAQMHLAEEKVRIWQASFVGTNSDETPGTVLEVNKSGLLVQCGSGQLRLEKLQLPGGKPLAIADLLNSKRSFLESFVGTQLQSANPT